MVDYHISTTLGEKPNVFNIYKMIDVEREGKTLRECLHEPYIEAVISVSYLQEPESINVLNFFKKRKGVIHLEIGMQFMNENGYPYKYPMPPLSHISKTLDVVVNHKHYAQINKRPEVFNKEDPNAFILSYVTDPVALSEIYAAVIGNVNFALNEWWNDLLFKEEAVELADILHQRVNQCIISLIGEM